MRTRALILSFLVIVICAFLFVFIKQQEIFIWAANRTIRAHLGPRASFSTLSVSHKTITLHSFRFGSYFKAQEVIIAAGARAWLLPGKAAASMCFTKAKLFGIDLISGNAAFLRKKDEAHFFHAEAITAYGTPGVSVTVSGLFIPNGEKKFLADTVRFAVSGSKGFISACTLSEAGFSGSLGLAVQADDFRKACGLERLFEGEVALSGNVTGSDKGLLGAMEFSSKRLATDSIALTDVAGNAFFSAKELVIPSVTLSLYGGKAHGRMAFAYTQKRKTYDIRLAMSGMDLNQVKSKSNLLAFNGRYSGTVELSGEAETWAKVLEKMKLF